MIDSPNNVYDVPAGPQLSSPSHAAWNYEFSIHLRPGGIGTLTLSDIIATLTVTDPNGHTAQVDPLTHWADDSHYGSLGQDKPADPTVWGAQNSENPIFADFPLAAFYNMNTTGNYTFTLDVTDKSSNLLASDTIVVDVHATPAPATMWGGGLMMAAMLGLAGGKRLMRKSPAVV